jgi:hypothetical protein
VFSSFQAGFSRAAFVTAISASFAAGAMSWVAPPDFLVGVDPRFEVLGIVKLEALWAPVGKEAVDATPAIEPIYNLMDAAAARNKYA